MVGEKHSLPKETNVTIVPSLDCLPTYFATKDPNDIVILNWLQYHETNLFEEIKKLESNFNIVMTMDKARFSEQVQEYITVYHNMLKELKDASENLLPEALNYAKTCLEGAQHQDVVTDTQREVWLLAFKQKTEAFKNFTTIKLKESLNSMKEQLLGGIGKHDNTLIVLGLGSFGTWQLR